MIMNPDERNRLRNLKRKQIKSYSDHLQPQPPLKLPAGSLEKQPSNGPQLKRASQSDVGEEKCYYKPDWNISPTDSGLNDAAVSAQLCNEILLPADYDQIADKFPTFEAHLAGARTRCFEALTFVTALEQRLDVWLREKAKLREMLRNAQHEAQRFNDKAEDLARSLEEVKESLTKQKSADLEAARKELEEVKAETGNDAVEAFKNSEEFWDLVDARALMYYEGALDDVRARMALLYPEIDQSFLKNILEDEVETLAAADHGGAARGK